MKTRLITSFLAIPLVLAALLQPYIWVWGIIAFAVSILGLYEFYKATGIKENKALCIMGYLSVVYFIGNCFYPIAKLPYALWFMAVLCILMLIFNKTVNLSKIGITFLSTLYIPYLLSHIIYIRGIEGGHFYIWLVIIISFLTDSCAYFVGKGLGRHKLCPNLSPNKTVEGAIGGTLGGGLSCLLFGFVIARFFNADVNYINLFILGLMGAVAGQLGDLTASAIKRQYGIKDYGNLFPGHGGILDRIDSILFVIPIVYFFVRVFGILN